MCVHSYFPFFIFDTYSLSFGFVYSVQQRQNQNQWAIRWYDGWADNDIKSQSVLGPTDSLRPRFVLPARRSPSLFPHLSLRRSVSTLSFSHHPLASTCYVLRSVFIFVFCFKFNLILWFRELYVFVYSFGNKTVQFCRTSERSLWEVLIQVVIKYYYYYLIICLIVIN